MFRWVNKTIAIMSLLVSLPAFASELKVETLVEGAGIQADMSKRVTVHYEGRLEDGTIFDIDPQERVRLLIQKGYGYTKAMYPRELAVDFECGDDDDDDDEPFDPAHPSGRTKTASQRRNTPSGSGRNTPSRSGRNTPSRSGRSSRNQGAGTSTAPMDTSGA